eukprot:6464287-Amphidinium_carterae.1
MNPVLVTGFSEMSKDINPESVQKKIVTKLIRGWRIFGTQDRPTMYGIFSGYDHTRKAQLDMRRVHTDWRASKSYWFDLVGLTLNYQVLNYIVLTLLQHQADILEEDDTGRLHVLAG